VADAVAKLEPEQPDGLARRVLARAAADLPALLEELRGWVAMDTPSGDLPALDALAADLAERLARAGAEVDLVPSPEGDYVHARLRGDGAGRVALLCHHDTVFPAGTAPARPMSIVGDRALGPGVADMKGGVLVALQALRLLAELPGARSACGLVELVSAPDEESRTVPFRTIDRLEGFDAVLCMECGRPGNGIVTSRKGGYWVTVTAEGLAAHAGVAGERGRSALLAICREALRMAELDGARDGLSLHVTTLQAGEVVNSIAASAVMNLDMRAWHPDDLHWGLERLEAFAPHEGVELCLDAGTRVPPMERTPAVAGLGQAAAGIAAALGSPPIVEVATGGVSDACWTGAIGIPTLDGLGPIGDDDHGPAEWIEIGSIPQRCALVAGLVAHVGAHPPRQGGSS